MNMKKNSCLIFLLFICFVYLFIPGCSPGSIVLKDVASLKELNEMVKGSRVRVTTLDSIYEGENILITRDSTTLEILTANLKVVSFSNIKEIHFNAGSNMGEAIQLKDNQIFKARNIITSNMDSTVRFDAMIPEPFVFPTKDITKIQRWGHINSMFSGMRYGMISGALLGVAVGAVIGAGSGGSSNSGSHQGEEIGSAITAFTICGGSLGLVVGTGLGATIGQWEDIDIAYRFKENSP
jgi:hypothetical protein